MSNPAKKEGGRLFEGKPPLMWPSEFEDGTANVMADTTTLVWGRGLAIHRETLMVMVASIYFGEPLIRTPGKNDPLAHGRLLRKRGIEFARALESSSRP